MRRKIESKILLASKRRTIFIFPARCWKPRDSFAVCLKRGGEKRRFYFERRNRGGRERNHEEFSRASIGSGTRKGKSREGEISLCDRCYPATLNPCHSRRRANIFHRRGPRFPQTWKLSLSLSNLWSVYKAYIRGGGENISGQKGDKRRTKREEETGGIWKSQERRGIIFIVRLMIVAPRVDKKRG